MKTSVRFRKTTVRVEKTSVRLGKTSVRAVKTSVRVEKTSVRVEKNLSLGRKPPVRLGKHMFVRVCVLIHRLTDNLWNVSL